MCPTKGVAGFEHGHHLEIVGMHVRLVIPGWGADIMEVRAFAISIANHQIDSDYSKSVLDPSTFAISCWTTETVAAIYLLTHVLR